MPRGRLRPDGRARPRPLTNRTSRGVHTQLGGSVLAVSTLSPGERAGTRKGNLMGMFSDLMSKIFRPSTAASTPSAPAAPTGGIGSVSAPIAQPTGAVDVARAVDVAAILDKMASENKQKLDWRHSIVDLMKLVGMDSSLSARRELAADLRYSGDTGDTATMNIWLHKEVMKKLAENGGKVPQELLSR